ncbi:phosphonate ABC transporter, permease protein PhnE [Ferrigenium kumadai]|uniref:Phosphonate ABC transporter, permease protein PhnE n=1 Tax=Ferrigenium kumadai TaxID=1682490 RepID=A0AAN1SYM0_9PROT|nr:phosphonate ABC transporter, permease protein PhnE [Ferrigenium kumadai]BBI98490.1 phosphonate ABC transporter, permease protein PhnE [Ferrigenium kumadai]
MNKRRPSPPPVVEPATVVLLVGILALVCASFYSLSIKWGELFTADAVRSSLEFLRGFTPPELAGPFLVKIAEGMLETLSMSALGTAIAFVFGIALALPASGRFGAVARPLIRLALNILRSIPELVWAVILLVAAGLGPFAGTLALAVHTTGVLGRLFADAFENLPSAPEATLRINGARPMAAFFYAALPQVSPQLMSYTLYRWENNIRAAAILGVVGAGGLGQMLKYHLSLFQMQQAASVIFAMLLMIAAVDGISFWLRRRLTGN